MPQSLRASSFLTYEDEPARRSPAYRRAVTRANPALFGLIYLAHHLSGPETKDQITFSEFHFALAEQAKRWTSTSIDPGRDRDAYVAPRGCGKSTWMFLILPLWAGCHGHKSFIAAFADSGPQAEMHLGTFKKELETNALLRQDYPDMCSPARRSTGTTESDNRAMLITKSGFVFAAKGIDSSSLGMKVGQRRPDLILCHEVGTPMLAEDGTWIPVEQHSSFRGTVTREGRRVQLHGLPWPEVVTPEHRYWARRVQGGERYEKGRAIWEPHALDTEPGWVEAADLTKHHWIGAPIDRTIGEVEPIGFYAPTIERDPETNRIVTATPGYRPRVPAEFHDPDWWWLFGLWWGDGNLHGKYGLGITVNINDRRVISRVENLLTRYKIRYTHVPRQGCTQIVFSRAHLNRWLATWRSGPSRKQPPAWVERLPDRYLQELVWGYVDADGFVDRAAQAVRITSIHLPGLLAARRIFARMGAAASIRKSGGEPGALKILGRGSRNQQKYDIRVRQGAEALGFPFADQDRYDPTKVRTFIEGDMLWTKVRSVEHVAEAEFAPIKTETGTYVTQFGLSHNCDDLEPGEETYSTYQAEKRLGAFIDSVLPLNVYARVVLVGTVTMPGSIVHQLVKTQTAPEEPPEQWITDEKFRTHYFPAILTDPETGEERSLWPQKWSMDYLNSIRHTRSFKKNMQNDPAGRDGDYWNAEDFVYGEVPALTHQLLSIDPAVTAKKKSDFTALAVIGYSASEQRCVVRWARAVRIQPGAPLRTLVLRVLEQFPDIRGVLIETNQGGDVWRSVLHGLPVQIKTVHQSEPKEVRAARLLNFYQRRRAGLPLVMHETRLPAVEEQMIGFPKAPNDDLVDCVGTGVDVFLKAKKKAGASSAEPRYGHEDDDDAQF